MNAAPTADPQIFSKEEFAQIREGVDNAADEVGVAKVVVEAIVAKGVQIVVDGVLREAGLKPSAATLKPPLSYAKGGRVGVTKPLSFSGPEGLEITKPADRAAAGGGRLNPPLN